MKYLKFGFYSVVKKPLFNILIIIEVAAILVLGNMVISVFNSRAVLYEPYEDILSQDGYVFQSRLSRSYDPEMKFEKLCNSLKGDVTVIKTYQLFLQLDKNDMLSNANVYSVDENIYSKYNLPLLCGRWASTKKNSNGEIEAVITGGKTAEESKYPLDAVFDTEIGKIRIVGIIAANTYAPFVSMGTDSQLLNILNFYQVADETDQTALFVSSSADEALRNPCDMGVSKAFMYYNSEPTKEIRERNEQILMGGTRHLSELSVYRDNSIECLIEQYKKLLPILLCVFAIVLAELICSVAMNTKSQMRNYGIYFLCGCRWKGCLKISLAYSAILLTGGMIIGTAAFLIFQNTEYASLFEQNLAMDNIYITLAIFAVMLIISLVIPFFMVRGTSPVETIKEN